ncbi:hypothetical protein B0T25DRAFT_624582 [Lasiosphaeria hispida]|uniref:Ankyrin n=1 Tax=Lasiosphaeria hispida TaxID=260671 RepID=A0AAJ0MA83_9PEZI|nr:hypothetical protein B0T25DRAFT_624582 [Lasiosphaeria hispida]
MAITDAESRHISVLAGEGDLPKLRAADDYHQTAAHIAAKGGQARSIETLADILDTDEKKTVFFNMPNRFSGDRPVHTAMRHGYLEVLKVLVRHGADPTLPNRFGDKVMDYPGDYEQDEVRGIVEGFGKGGTTKREGI